MIEKSFFEFLGIADSERIQSQILAWIFSENFDSINNEQRSHLLFQIFDLPKTSKILRVITEYNRLDIFIETENEIIAIKNKLKSSQHSDQLSKYQQDIDKLHENSIRRFYFLTFAYEESKNEFWKNISYKKITKYLSELELIPNSNSIIFLEYLKTLTNSHTSFSENHLNFKNVFVNGGKRKSEKSNIIYDDNIQKFISDNQLETILQISFFRTISLQLENQKTIVFETRGDAILDIIINDQFLFEEKNYSSMLELQGKVIKFALIVNGEKNYNESKPEWIANLIPKISTLSQTNNFGYKRLNLPKSKAYISISKKMERSYWTMSQQELINYLKLEIENAKKMTKYLENQLE